VELGLFDEVGEALRGLLPAGLGDVRCRARRYGLKVWFGGDVPAKEHYEAQVIGASSVPDAVVLALEIGLHVEYPKEAENETVLAHLLAGGAAWRTALGVEAEPGPFLGGRDDWRRVSETWADPDLGDPGLAFEIAVRLTDYVTVLEPLRRAR
jgi:hypothetical protein